MLRCDPSFGVNHFGNQQVWRAQRFIDNGGEQRGNGFSSYDPTLPGPIALGPGPYTPLPQVQAETQVVPFVRENPLLVGGYLLGAYRWDKDVRLGLAQAYAWASQGDDTVLALEVDGQLVGPLNVDTGEVTADTSLITADTQDVIADTAGTVESQLVLLRGNPNTEVTGEVDLLGYVVPAGKMVRWKVLSGPVPQDAAWACALTMQVST